MQKSKLQVKIQNYFPWLILLVTISFNLWLNYPETQIAADPNDNIFQYSLVNRTDQVWRNYGCPLSFSCLPNLTDHLVPNWAEGYSLPFYYTHVPQIATVASYNLLIKPFFSLFAYPFTLYAYYNWTKYLLYTLFPIPVFIALRLVGFNPILSAISAFLASHYSTDGLYGIDPVSSLWRGYGLTSQLYGIFFLPLALAFTYRALSSVRSNIKDQRPARNASLIEAGGSKTQIKDQKYNTLGSIAGDASGGPPISAHLRTKESEEHLLGVTRGRPRKLKSDIFFAIIFLTLTTAGHLGVGIMGFLSLIPFLFLDLKKFNIISRFKRLAIIYLGTIFLLSYWIIPVLLNNNYHIISFWDPIWKFNSYGWYEVVRQYFMGEIFDWERLPIITILVTIGFFSLLLNSRLFPFALLFSFWVLMYFGRTTWGGLIDLIPGMKDFHQHRFIVGIQIASLFLLPAGLEYIFKKIWGIITLILERVTRARGAPKSGSPCGWILGLASGQDPQIIIKYAAFIIFSIAFISTLAYFTAIKTYDYAILNNKWIYEANTAYKYDEKNFQDLTGRLDMLPPARIYAGRPGNWGKDFRLGSTQIYMLFGALNYDISQFLPETWSPLSENEQNFDERTAEDYDLLNIRYIVADKNHDFTDKASLDKKYGPFELYTVPTTGWFDVVTSPMFVTSDKTNYINIVHLWFTSYARRWKMHPLISVEKNPNIPDGMRKILQMKDEVSYINLTGGDASAGRQDPPINNIFSDYPFVFPEATPSGKISNEKVERQTYSGTVEIPDNCKSCFIMFKMSYHPNWTVKLDGQLVKKYAVFPFYLAVPAGPGSHKIEFTYQPNGLKVLLIIGEIIAVIVSILYFILRQNPPD